VRGSTFVRSAETRPRCVRAIALGVIRGRASQVHPAGNCYRYFGHRGSTLAPRPSPLVPRKAALGPHSHSFALSSGGSDTLGFPDTAHSRRCSQLHVYVRASTGSERDRAGEDLGEESEEVGERCRRLGCASAVISESLS
jgi:hypothetical protein